MRPVSSCRLSVCAVMVVVVWLFALVMVASVAAFQDALVPFHHRHAHASLPRREVRLLLVGPGMLGVPSVQRSISSVFWQQEQPKDFFVSTTGGRASSLWASSISSLAPDDASTSTPSSRKSNNWKSQLLGSFLALQQRLRTVDDEVMKWRFAALAFLSSLVFFRKAIDVQLAALWTQLMTSSSVVARIFRCDSYEWCLAVMAFFVWIHGFWYADRAVQKAGEAGKVHPWRKYRLQDRFEADQHRRMFQTRQAAPTNALAAAADAAMSQPPPPPLTTKQSKWNLQAWVFELWVYVLPLLMWDILAPRRHRRLAPFGAPTTLQMLGGIFFGLVIYDFLFFLGHVIMHKVPFVFRAFHAKHHKVQEVRAGDIVRLSFAEEVYDVVCSIIALNLLSVHPLARGIYNCVITFLLTELHCGFDFPWSPQNVVPFGLMTGSRRHHYHHRTGRHYYQKFFFTVDRLFGFFQKDDGSLHGDSVKPNPYIPESWK